MKSKHRQNLRETIYLGWDAATLPTAASALVQKCIPRFGSADASGDHSNLLCVLPTARSVHRIGQLLDELLGKRPSPSQAPQIITVGELPERLYHSAMPPALEFEQTLAWASVMRSADPEAMTALLPNLPPADPISAWLELASTIRRLQEDLASDNLSFEQVAEKTDSESEQRRWRMLAFLAQRYREQLDQAGLIDVDLARAQAIQQNQCRCDETIVLIGTSDLSDQLQSMLQNLRGDIVTMIAAPESEQQRFDSFGRVRASAWSDHQLPLRDDQLLPAGDISDQAVAVTESLQSFGKSSSVVGITDASQLGPVEMELRGVGCETFRAVGWTVASTSIGRLFDLVATHVQSGTWQSLAALVRHARVSEKITEHLGDRTASRWLGQLDGLLANHYPRKLTGQLPEKAIQKYPLAVQVAQWVAEWLAVFQPKGKEKEQTLGRWCQVLHQWLQSTYTDPVPTADNAGFLPGFLDQPNKSCEAETATKMSRDQEYRTQLAIEAASKLLKRFASLSDRLDVNVSGGVAVEMMASRLSELRIVAPPDHQAVQIIGWLDLALEDTDSLTVVGLNHPFVPAAITADPFLPGSLRSTLRMADNQRRYARDVYAMHLMLSVRDRAHFIVGKFGADGSPTPPSRLIAAAAKPDSARRICFLLEGKRDLAPVDHGWDAQVPKTKIPIPVFAKSDSGQVMDAISVTGFKDYLTCPYRFYLRHVLKLKPVDDQRRELAANQFGDLVHGSLEAFGQSSDKNETSAAKIQASLLEHLHAYADQQYGSDVSVAVSLQITQAERRLATLAVRHARRIDQGWTIHATEASVSPSDGAKVIVPEGSMGLKGRFDRIDFHRETGQWAILDYKTHGHRPEKKHLKKIDGEMQWIDLQLPLYRMMIPFLGIDVPPKEVQLGYFNVSDKDDETKINIAEFSEELMSQAETKIHECVSGVLRQEFEPTSDRVDFDDYGMILQEGIAGKMADTLADTLGDAS